MMDNHLPFSPVLPKERKQGRSLKSWVVAVGSGVALLALIALSTSTPQPLSPALTEKAAEESHHPVLSSAQQQGIKVQLKTLSQKIKAEQDQASKLDKEAANKESKFKSKLLSAKKDETEAAHDSQGAKRLASKASEAEDEANRLLAESKKAKAAFLASEQPIEKAGKLASHDKDAYRHAELKVAQLVTKLSEHPGDSKLSKEVASYVSKAKKERKMMESDHKLLTQIQEKTAGIHVGGAKGWGQLKDRSVSLSRKGKDLKLEADNLSSKASDLKSDGNHILSLVQKGMVKPERLHEEAKEQRSKYAKNLKTLKLLRNELAEAEPTPTLSSSPKNSVSASLSKSSSSGAKGPDLAAALEASHSAKKAHVMSSLVGPPPTPNCVSPASQHSQVPTHTQVSQPPSPSAPSLESPSFFATSL